MIKCYSERTKHKLCSKKTAFVILLQYTAPKAVETFPIT